MSKQKMVSVVFRLPREKLEAIKALSAKTRIRQSEYLREAIADMLVKRAMLKREET